MNSVPIRPTLESFSRMTTFISFLQSAKLKEAFYPMALADGSGNKGEYGEIFDSDVDRLSIGAWQSFEMERMEEDIRMCGELGVDGVVFGCLTENGDVDIEQNRRLMECAKGMSVTFHRAFDRTADPFSALEDIISLGCNRILTSGQQPKAIDGTPLLAKLQEKAAGRITLLAGSGVNEDNIRDIYDATGISEYHFSARVGIKSKMKNICQNVYMGAKDADEQNILVTDKDRVRNTIDMLTK